MIKITKENGDMLYLNIRAFTHVKYCKDTNMLVAYPLVDPISKITVDGILKIEDNVEIKEVQAESPKNNFYSDPVETILNWIISNQHSHNVSSRLRKVFEYYGITRVGELIEIGKKNFCSYRSVGRQSITVISDSLEELYGTEW